MGKNILPLGQEIDYVSKNVTQWNETLYQNYEGYLPSIDEHGEAYSLAKEK